MVALWWWWEPVLLPHSAGGLEGGERGRRAADLFFFRETAVTTGKFSGGWKRERDSLPRVVVVVVVVVVVRQSAGSAFLCVYIKRSVRQTPCFPCFFPAQKKDAQLFFWRKIWGGIEERGILPLVAPPMKRLSIKRNQLLHFRRRQQLAFTLPRCWVSPPFIIETFREIQYSPPFPFLFSPVFRLPFHRLSLPPSLFSLFRCGKGKDSPNNCFLNKRPCFPFHTLYISVYHI